MQTPPGGAENVAACLGGADHTDANPIFQALLESDLTAEAVTRISEATTRLWPHERTDSSFFERVATLTAT